MYIALLYVMLRQHQRKYLPVLVTIECHLCYKKIQGLACILECDLCHVCFYLNCISLNKDERIAVTNDRHWSWIPSTMYTSSVSFNHIEEDRISISAISGRKNGGFLLNLTNYDCYLLFEATEEN